MVWGISDKISINSNLIMQRSCYTRIFPLRALTFKCTCAKFSSSRWGHGAEATRGWEFVHIHSTLYTRLCTKYGQSGSSWEFHFSHYREFVTRPVASAGSTSLSSWNQMTFTTQSTGLGNWVGEEQSNMCQSLLDTKFGPTWPTEKRMLLYGEEDDGSCLSSMETDSWNSTLIKHTDKIHGGIIHYGDNPAVITQLRVAVED